MNLQTAIEASGFKVPMKVKVEPKKRSRVQVAKRVFQLAAQGGFPYKFMTPQDWAKKWLPSEEFTLMEIDIHAAASMNINAAASPHPPKNPNRVNHYMNCSVESMDPIVVDCNKQKVGKSFLGYVPEVVVLDGKHRKKAQLAQGRTKILAWVGCRALKKMPPKVVKVVDASTVILPKTGSTKMDATYEIYASTVPAIKGKEKHVKAKGKDCNACGARSSGSLEDPSASDITVPPDSSDTKQAVEASDQLKWNPNKPQMNAPGTKGWNTELRGRNNPISDAPGSGVGPRLKPNTGASRSEYSRLLAKGVVVDKMYEEFKAAVASGYKGTWKASAPPGREDQVKDLKKKYGEDSSVPFKIAWYQHNQGKS